VVKPIQVLVIEEDLEYASMLQVLFEATGGYFMPVYVDSMQQTLLFLRNQNPDVILLDLCLADSQGVDTFIQVQTQSPQVPIVVIAAEDDQEVAIEIIRKGAQDLLNKETLDANTLLRSLSYAVERQRALVMLQRLSLNDDLTNLLNRRGFHSLAQQQMKIAKRAKWNSILLFADLDGLKEVNDTFGHTEGDRALRAVAGILKKTFRTSDLIARLGGDEYVVLAINANDRGVETILNRLQKNVDQYNARNKDYHISLSYGIAQCSANSQESIDDLIAKADEALYRHKRSKRKQSSS
jgi:two-component system, cell cycle response regulator